MPKRPLTATERADVESVVPYITALIGSRFQWALRYADREDIVQAALEAACRARQRYRPDDGTWSNYASYRAKGAVYDYMRQQRPGTRGHPEDPPVSLNDDSDLVAQLVEEEPAIEAEELLRDVDRVLDELPPAISRAFVLVVYLGLTQIEAGELEGVTGSAISFRLSRARAHLAARRQSWATG